MGRAKLKLKLISNSRSRRTTFEKRKKGLMKKAGEFKTLCGVDTCVIINPIGISSDGLVKMETWPPDRKEVERIVRRYQSEATDRRARHATGLHEFFASRKKKIDAELAKAHRANWEAKYPVSEEIFKDLSDPQLRSLLSAVDDRLEQAKTRLATMKEKRRVEKAAPNSSVGSNHDYSSPLISLPPEDSTQFGPSREDYSWCSTVNEAQSMICDPRSNFYHQIKLKPHSDRKQSTGRAIFLVSQVKT
ncbi:hypothetical protein EUGRSUZ_F02794 [Eucalyptus grandis]|uniref:Uncharacterized protein n=2 Tax=Eucalyptus grandis TaxID=71139 RepID=A0ACC3KJJ0_EUCGR|nr:hypothetical protein EUGRSUZ_F02794 [Eucalyptus grandis]